MKNHFNEIHRKRKKKILDRLANKPFMKPRPMFEARNSHYELADRTDATHCGGIGAMHMLASNTGLREAIDQHIHLLKIHLPYHESDHVLNMAYNLLAGGNCVEDLEWRRQDEAYMNALKTTRIPDPTTAGDFLRRFSRDDVIKLMDLVNDIRVLVWKKKSLEFRQRGILQVDATIQETYGECKEGMDISYDGRWGFAPVFVTLANTREHLYMENRPGNVPSQTNSTQWIDRAIAVAKKAFKEVWIRGDSAYALTDNFDRWSEGGVNFVFSYDSMAKLREKSQEIMDWEELERLARHIKTSPRRRPVKVKDRIVKKRGFKNVVLEREEISEFSYQPYKCKRLYRVVVVLKVLKVQEGQRRLFDEIREFFYITNNETMSPEEIVSMANDRCDHENDIEQLKNGVHALKMPTGELVANWAYMVIASLAWTLKAWMGLLMPNRETGEKIIRMEFRRFINGFMHIPAQIVYTGRRLIHRLLHYMECAPQYFDFLERCRLLRL